MKGNPDYGIRENSLGTRLIFLLVESEIRETFACGIRNTAQGIRNPTNDWNSESMSHGQRLESSTWNPEFTAWNPESKTVLDSLTWSVVCECACVVYVCCCVYFDLLTSYFTK